MRIVQFRPSHLPVVTEQEPEAGGEDFFWLDVERSEPEWHRRVQPWLGGTLHDRHHLDCLNDQHPPFYDGTDEYEMLIIRTQSPAGASIDRPATGAIAFILTQNALVSIKAAGDPVFDHFLQRSLVGLKNPSDSPVELLIQLVDQVVNTLLDQRSSVSELLNDWQECLFERRSCFTDWRELMALRAQLRRLEIGTESQVDVLERWREETSLVLDQSLEIRFNDLKEHLHRVYHHAVITQNDLDALVQVYFSANTQKTNRILQVLTIVSALFLPLNLIAGIFGMNFEHLPLLQSWYGPWAIGGLMLTIVFSLLIWFRTRRWL